MTPRTRDVVVAAALVAVKSAAMLFALHAGFAQISDDDYARTVIAQTFAHAPRLDPSGTSWLPFPFWIYGGAMLAFGRSLGTARALAFALGALSPVPVFAGMRSLQNTPIVSAGGALLAALTPWSVWLALAPVPEGWAGACAAAALLFLDRRPIFAACLVLVASLSRYEAWPIAAFIACVCMMRAVRRREVRGVFVAAAALAALGPIAWLANNAFAHGDAFHFVARVAAFRRANTTPMPIAARLFEYPHALWEDARAIVLAGAVGVVAAARDREMRARWVLPLGGAALAFAFLVYGDVADGAPTHHPIRALVPVLTVLATFGAAGAASLARHAFARVAFSIAFAACVVLALLRVRFPPGAGDSEKRDAQLARGRSLAGTQSLEVTPCAYEHFALIAAFGAPERVTIEPSTHEPVTANCPRVVAHPP
jgi:hypothetical protein